MQAHYASPGGASGYLRAKAIGRLAPGVLAGMVRHARRLVFQVAEVLVLPPKEGNADRDTGTDQPASAGTWLVLNPVNCDGLTGLDDLSFRGVKRRGIWSGANPLIPRFLPAVGMTLLAFTWTRY